MKYEIIGYNMGPESCFWGNVYIETLPCYIQLEFEVLQLRISFPTLEIGNNLVC